MTTWKTRYIRDPKNEDRVVTLVTKVDGNQLTFAYAVNATPPVRLRRLPRMGDRFQRKLGATIAHGRVESGKGKNVEFVPEKDHPFVAALTFLALEKNSVARIAFSELKKLADSPSSVAELARNAVGEIRQIQKAKRKAKRAARREMKAKQIAGLRKASVAA